MNVDEMREMIDTAIAKAKAEGWTIRPGGWLNVRAKTCCPLSAVRIAQQELPPVGKGGNEVLDFLEGIFGLAKVADFTQVFDHGLSSAGLAHLPATDTKHLGREYRARYERGEL